MQAFFFIGESLGMQELIVIGVIALIVFGPRKIPQLARTIGKTMAEFRKATQDFRSTWEKEVDLENLEREAGDSTTANTIANSQVRQQMNVIAPEVKSLDEGSFDPEKLRSHEVPPEPESSISEPSSSEPASGKRDWI